LAQWSNRPTDFKPPIRDGYLDAFEALHPGDPEGTAMTELVFLDTECTGLAHDADIWEFAAVRRHADGSRDHLHMFVDHDRSKAAYLPEPFRTDYALRCPAAGTQLVPPRIAARKIWEFIDPRAVVVGAVAAFDSQKLATLFARHRLPMPGWLYTGVDVCALAAGYLQAQGETIEFPVHLEQLGQRLGLRADNYDRHTAMGDVVCVEHIFDRCVTGRASARADLRAVADGDRPVARMATAGADDQRVA
jgi:DNA polymerase III epsilon subunit-like protein